MRQKPPVLMSWVPAVILSVEVEHMHKVSLADFVADKGQSQAAALLGMTQPGLSKALKAGREIYVAETSSGRCVASEVRPFPSQQRREQAAG